MARRGLLGRLASTTPERRVEVMESVVEHLRSLLNMRQGSAVTVPEMGVPDFTDLVHSFPGSGVTLTKAIRATIMTFEPRLRNVLVRHVAAGDSELAVRFEISAQLADDSNTPVKFRTEFAPGGRMDVWTAGMR
jgi:type VI secretion system protein